MKKSKGRIVFEVINVIVLSLLSFACLFPLLNILAMSFSSSTAVAAGKVSIFPVEFNLYAYKKKQKTRIHNNKQKNKTQTNNKKKRF